MDLKETDRRLRDLYGENSAPVDMEEFSARLRERLARTRGRRSSKPELAWSSRGGSDKRTHQARMSFSRRPKGLRVAVFASIALVLVAAITLGSLEAAKRLGQDQPVLVISDDGFEISPGSTGQTDQTSSSVGSTGGTPATTQAPTATTAPPVEIATVVWKFQAGGPVYGPAIADGVVYFGSGDGFLYAVEAETGTEIWRFQTDGPVTATPTVSDGVAYVGSWDGCLYAVDVENGAELWKFQTGESITGGSPTVSDGVVYIGNNEGLLYAVDIENGAELWRFQALGQITASPVVSDGRVFVGSWGVSGGDMDGLLYAVDAQNGAEVWSFEATSSIVASAALLDGAVLFIVYDAGDIYSLDARTGAVNWKAAIDPTYSMPVIADGMIYLTAQMGGILLALDANGKPIWSYLTEHERERIYGEGAMASPAVSEGVAYFGDAGGFVFAVDAQTGNENWRFEAGDSVRSTPAVLNGVVYVGSDDGCLYALK